MIEWSEEKQLYKFNPLINWTYEQMIDYINQNQCTLQSSYMIKDLSVLDVHRVQGLLNRVKMQEPDAGGGKHHKRNVACMQTAMRKYRIFFDNRSLLVR